MINEQQCSSVLDASDTFVRRHLGPNEEDVRALLLALGLESLEALVDETVPKSIRLRSPLVLDTAHLGADESVRSEWLLSKRLGVLAGKNRVFRSFIGCGYHGTITPAVIQRNVLEDPGWYTQYTPYQAEIAQGRLEALLNFQTMVSELTALPLAGASLLDEATAAAEAMAMCVGIHTKQEGPKVFFVDRRCHPQTVAVVRTRAEPLEVTVMEGDAIGEDFGAVDGLCGVLLQYPGTDGSLVDWREVIERAHSAGALAVMAADLLALCLVEPPGVLGADIAVGTTQRFGVPMNFGGPHAGYIATKTEHSRRLPGRIIGVSRDVHGNVAYRMAIQTREQHIRRERATSNICTAQALLAIMAGFYAVYHGDAGLRRIALRVNGYARAFAKGITKLGHDVLSDGFFDGVKVSVAGGRGAAVLARAYEKGMNLRDYGDGTVGVFFDETTTRDELGALFEVFDLSGLGTKGFCAEELLAGAGESIDGSLKRKGRALSHQVFERYHSESEMLRYITKLRGRDLSLAHSMIPLGSCTMKLNATVEMLAVTWREMVEMHPFAPKEQAKGYTELFEDLERWLGAITGFDAVSLQPNAGAQGEYTGLLVIRAYHRSHGDNERTVCLIPESAHGTNPASAAMVGMQVVVVRCLPDGSVDLSDLGAKAELHAKKLAAVMVTYPSTYGVFDENVREICEIVHSHGGQVYMDGANLNAQVGLTSPGEIGADVCHINLHKTFCIPHGGGGPGMGPIAVKKHLREFLPGHPFVAMGERGENAIGPVSAAPYGSPAILSIPWVYMALMGAEGLGRATAVAILNANYLMQRLEGHYTVLFKGARGRCAHEFIIDVRPFEKSAGVKADDIAKRLMDYGFHAPTMSFPVAGTLMIEPTESESKAELDRFADAMIAIREEIKSIESGTLDKTDNPLKNAPHTAHAIAGQWLHSYSREQAAYPAAWLRDAKFWPHVGRIDNPFGDRNLVCVCPPMSDYEA